MTSTAATAAPPRGWQLFTGLALLLGGAGLAGNAIFLFMNLSHGMSLHGTAGQTLFLLSLLHLARSGGYFAGGLAVRGRVPWGRPVIILCAASALLELACNAAAPFLRGSVPAATDLAAYVLVPFLLEGSLLWYFCRRQVGTYVARRG